MRTFHRWSPVALGALLATVLFQGCDEHQPAIVEPSHEHTVATVQIEPATLTLEEGDTFQMRATPACECGEELDVPVDWSSLNPDVATVDDRGLVIALAGGEARITAAAGSVHGSASAMVQGKPAGEFGNNLSHPVIFADGLGMTGADVTEDAGLRPTAQEEAAVDALPFFWEGNEPDYGGYYMQQGANTWQAEWIGGGAAAWSRQALVAWGDNLTHHAWNTHSRLRVEHVLYAEGAEPMRGYEMTWLFGEGANEMQGTDGTVYDAVPTVYSVLPRLTIEKLEGTDPEGEPGSPVCEVFSGALYEGVGEDGPGYYTAEVNVAGKIIYGFNFMIRDVDICPDVHRYGWWRVTFRLDDQGAGGGVPVTRSVDLVGLAAGEEDGDELMFTPQIDPTTHTTWLDIYVESARGGGGGGGSHDDGHDH